MSNSQFKKEEAKYHNEQYEAMRYREQHNLPEWKDVSNRNKTYRPNLDNVEEVKLTEPTESKITEQQAVGRADRGTKDIAVLGAGQTGFGRAARRIMGQVALEKVAKQIAFATPEMLGEIGREQARKDIAIIQQGDDLVEAKKLAGVLSLAGGKYATHKSW